MDSIAIVSIVVASVSCLISIFSYFNTREKEYIDKIDAWCRNFENKVNKFLQFLGTHSALAFKYDFSNSLILNFNTKNNIEEYNAYLKEKVFEKDRLKSAYQECNAIVNVSFKPNENQILIENLVNKLYIVMDKHLQNVLELNEIRLKFYCNQISEEEVKTFLEDVFKNIRELIIIHHIIEKMKNLTVNAIQVNLINNRSVMCFSSKKLLKWMVNFVESFDEYKYYQTKKMDGLSEEFCKWWGSVDREIDLCKNEVLGNLKHSKKEFQRSVGVR